MRKLLILAIVALVALTLAIAGVVSANPVKPSDPYAGKTAGNTGFANFVDDNFLGTIDGWVRYSKDSGSLHTTWVVNGLQPGAWYQLKLHSKFGDPNVGNACGAPNQGAIWMCGFWGGESFLVMAIVQADGEGHISAGVNETQLPSASYTGMQFIVTENASPWSSAWTWENPWPTISSFTIK